MMLGCLQSVFSAGAHNKITMSSMLCSSFWVGQIGYMRPFLKQCACSRQEAVERVATFKRTLGQCHRNIQTLKASINSLFQARCRISALSWLCIACNPFMGAELAHVLPFLHSPHTSPMEALSMHFLFLGQACKYVHAAEMYSADCLARE